MAASSSSSIDRENFVIVGTSAASSLESAASSESGDSQGRRQIAAPAPASSAAAHEGDSQRLQLVSAGSQCAAQEGCVSYQIPDSGLAYRVLQLPPEVLQQNAHITVPALQHVFNHSNIPTPSEADVVNAVQPVLVNASGIVASSDAKLAYVPAGTIAAMANNGNINPTQLHLQGVDPSAGQYFIVLPSGEAAASTTNAVSQTKVLTGNAASRLQPATFIPLSKLEANPASARTLAATSASPSGGTLTFGSMSFVNREPGVKEVKRRVSHNEVEKRRRDKINNWIMRLARIIPTSDGDQSKQGQSKGGILAKTVEYINELRATNTNLLESLNSVESLHVELEMMRRQIGHLRQENRTLRQRLTDAGIPLPSSPVLPGRQQPSMMDLQHLRQQNKTSAQMPVDSTSAAGMMMLQQQQQQQQRQHSNISVNAMDTGDSVLDDRGHNEG